MRLLAVKAVDQHHKFKNLFFTIQYIFRNIALGFKAGNFTCHWLSLLSTVYRRERCVVCWCYI